MFVDRVDIVVSSGKGGAGCASFRREKFVTKGGPDGGDGGRGGDVYFVVDNNTHTLAGFKGNKHLKAENGRPGMGARMFGKYGKSITISVPPGTQIRDRETKEVLHDLTQEGDKVKFLEGGKGGLGNYHFKSSTNQKPTYCQPGKPGQTRELSLELKMIADVALVGFPNVGKSTLISTLSNAKPEIANYEFTTLTPKLGEVRVTEYDAFIMADIPGIIGGASEGKGLGHDFLRHIERTKVLLFMLDIGNYRTLSEQYEILRKEVKAFSPKLESRDFAVAITRTDIYDQETNIKLIDEFLDQNDIPHSKETHFGSDTTLGFFEHDQAYEVPNNDTPQFVYPIASVSQYNTQALVFALYECVKRARSANKE